MAYMIGIDTGGTYTDAVLLDADRKSADAVIRKSKSFTTHERLEAGIENSIKKLDLTEEEIAAIEKIVLSTTLATNAIVEGKIHDVGLILIGGLPRGQLATEHVRQVRGKVNIKGRVLLDIDRYEVSEAVKWLEKDVDSIAVSCVASVRNPILEQKVREIICGICDLPVICGHELASDLGFLERTNTAVINGGLLPIINSFIQAMKKVLSQNGIKAPVFVVKGDGTITKSHVIKNTPVDTVLSGPAASIIGAINLTEAEHAVVADMGGTTTDTGVVRNKRVELSPDGAQVGNWKIKIKSAKLYTFGLGGDSHIKVKDSGFEIGPERIVPACRRGDGDAAATPTDVLHYSNDFAMWDREKAVTAIRKQAETAGLTADAYICGAKDAVAKKIHDHLRQYEATGLPVIAIGAPAKSWYEITRKKYDLNLIIPEHYEVANAVGAATAGICAVGEAVIRPGEDGGGFLVHGNTERFAFNEMTAALNKALAISRAYAVRAIEEQGLEPSEETYECESVYQKGDRLVHMPVTVTDEGKINCSHDPEKGKFVEAKVKVLIGGNMFA